MTDPLPSTPWALSPRPQGGVAVACRLSGAIVLVDDDLAVERSFPAGIDVLGVAVDPESGLVVGLSQLMCSALVIDPAATDDATAVRAVPGPLLATDVVAHEGRAFTADTGTSSVTEVDLPSAAVVGNHSVPGRPWRVAVTTSGAVVAAGDGWWATATRGEEAEEDRAGATVPDAGLLAVTADDARDGVVVVGNRDGIVRRFSSTGAEEGTSTPLGAGMTDVAVAGGVVAVVDHVGHRVLLLDADDLRVVDTVAVAHPLRLAVAKGPGPDPSFVVACPGAGVLERVTLPSRTVARTAGRAS